MKLYQLCKIIQLKSVFCNANVGKISANCLIWNIRETLNKTNYVLMLISRPETCFSIKTTTATESSQHNSKTLLTTLVQFQKVSIRALAVNYSRHV